MGWKYYNHAMIPDTPPHESINTDKIEDGSIWKETKGTPLLARWTTEFDCGYETNWWYVIKDSTYDVMELKAKRRYEITKGRKNFVIEKIEPIMYSKELYGVQVASFAAYPEKYRETVDFETFISTISAWGGDCFAAFSKNEDDGEYCTICGYSYLERQGKCIHFYVQKTDPQHERNGVNAALVDGVLNFYQNELGHDVYICDGQRSIAHETAFQDYLEKYFGFRKAYCKMNISYHPLIRWMIPILYLFKNVCMHFDNNSFFHKINSILRMEQIIRDTQNTENDYV